MNLGLHNKRLDGNGFWESLVTVVTGCFTAVANIKLQLESTSDYKQGKELAAKLPPWSAPPHLVSHLICYNMTMLRLFSYLMTLMDCFLQIRQRASLFRRWATSTRPTPCSFHSLPDPCMCSNLSFYACTVLCDTPLTSKMTHSSVSKDLESRLLISVIDE